MAIGDFSVREFSGQIVVSLGGELDATDAASVAAALAQVSALASHIIVEVAGLDFIDSSGLAALVLAEKHARNAGGALLLASPPQQLLRILARIGLTNAFPVYECVEDAARALGPSASTAQPVPGDPSLAALS